MEIVEQRLGAWIDGLQAILDAEDDARKIAGG
jgi:hypothetical protein